MKLLQQLIESTEKSSASERQRVRIYAAVQKLLDKEFSGNDALATDLLSGMMDFYDSHLHLQPRSKEKGDVLQDAEDSLRQLLPRTARVKATGDNVNVSLGSFLDATVIPKGKHHWDVVVAGFKQDIPLDTKGYGLLDVATMLKDIARKGKKWFQENDPDGDQW